MKFKKYIKAGKNFRKKRGFEKRKGSRK